MKILILMVPVNVRCMLKVVAGVAGFVGMFFLAPIIGGLVGSHLLGFHGCVAVSAGLAYLGGGSLASGGMGMAGGRLLLQITGAVSGLFYD